MYTVRGVKFESIDILLGGFPRVPPSMKPPGVSKLLYLGRNGHWIHLSIFLHSIRMLRHPALPETCHFSTESPTSTFYTAQISLLTISFSINPPLLYDSCMASSQLTCAYNTHTHRHTRTLNTPSSSLIMLRQIHSFIFLEFLLHIFPIATTTVSLHRNDSKNILFCQKKCGEERKVIPVFQRWNEMK